MVSLSKLSWPLVEQTYILNPHPKYHQVSGNPVHFVCFRTLPLCYLCSDNKCYLVCHMDVLLYALQIGTVTIYHKSLLQLTSIRVGLQYYIASIPSTC